MSIGAVPIEYAAAVSAGQGSARGELLGELVRQKSFYVGAVILGFWILAAIFGNLLVPHDPLAQNLLSINQSPSGSHWFGTDGLGRDMFARVITGSRDILITAPLATLLGTIIGTALGLTMGYLRGIVDEVLGRFVEAFLALPLV
ncbi:MAG: ABC transporter permease, partial [Trebonia sp.]